MAIINLFPTWTKKMCTGKATSSYVQKTIDYKKDRVSVSKIVKYYKSEI